MIIESLKMENFRQYYGVQTIKFAQPGSNQLVTVILGENGRGKTGIYRAIMFALFGDVKLAQDAKEADILLANIKAVEEQAKEGKGINCSVTLDFTHRDERYTVERTYFAMKDDQGKQREEPFHLYLINHTTNEEWHSEKEIREVIDKIIDERVKHYFFFDGERIERLTRVSVQQKQEVTSGIKNLLKIDKVLKAKAVFQRMLTNAKKELEQLSTGDYKKALRKQRELEADLEQLKNEAENYEQKSADIISRLTEIDSILNEYEAMSESIKEREQLENNLDNLEKEIEQAYARAKKLNKYIPLLLGENVYQQQLVHISNELVEEKSGIDSQFIESLLEDMRCICGTTFDKESSMYKELSMLAESVKKFEANQKVHNLYNELKQLIAYLEGRTEQIEHAQQEINELQAKKEQIQYKLEEINERLSKSGEEKIKELNIERENLNKEYIEMKYLLEKNAEDREELKKEISAHLLHVKELERQTGLHENALRKRDVLEKANDTLQKVIKRFEKEILEDLEHATTQNLYYLLDSSGREMIKEAKVMDDYSLEVMNHYGQPFLANISQGQRQVLSLSFITALAQVAGGEQTMEMPLFMDTPFGRLSGQHQKNLIEYLPQVCSQWILLVTDREFGEKERQEFIENEAIGKFYELISKEPGVTKIVEVPIEALYEEGVIEYE